MVLTAMVELDRSRVAGMNIHYLFFPLDYFLDAQVEAGIENLEFWCGTPHFWLDGESFGDCRRLRRMVSERGLEIIAFTPGSTVYQYQYAAQEADQYEKSFRYFRNGIRAAAELGCRLMAVNSGWGYHNEPRENAWARSREMLGRLAVAADREGIVLALESLRPEESQLVVTLADAKRMVQEVGHSALKTMIDTTAVGVAGETVSQWFEAFGADIVHSHFVDGTPYGHLAWGDGTRSLEEHLACFAANGYRGYLSQELTDGRYLADPRSADLDNMRRLGQSLGD